MDESHFIPTRHAQPPRHRDTGGRGWVGAAGTAALSRRDLNDHALRPPPAMPVLTQQDLAAAWQEGFAAGHAAAAAAAEASRAARVSQSLDAIAAALVASRADAACVADQAAGALSHALIAAMRAVMPDLIRRAALHESSAMLAHVMPGLSREPHVDIDVAPGLEDDIAALLAALPPASRTAIKVAGQPGMAAGDLRIRWQSGQARRQPAEIWRAVMNALNAATGQPGSQENVHAQ